MDVEAPNSSVKHKSPRSWPGSARLNSAKRAISARDADRHEEERKNLNLRGPWRLDPGVIDETHFDIVKFGSNPIFTGALWT